MFSNLCLKGSVNGELNSWNEMKFYGLVWQAQFPCPSWEFSSSMENHYGILKTLLLLDKKRIWKLLKSWFYQSLVAKADILFPSTLLTYCVQYKAILLTFNFVDFEDVFWKQVSWATLRNIYTCPFVVSKPVSLQFTNTGALNLKK